MAGVKKSFAFQRVVAGVWVLLLPLGCFDIYHYYLAMQEIPRGYYCDSLGNQSSLLAHVYSLVRSTKQHRRAFLRALLRYFEDYEVHLTIKSC